MEESARQQRVQEQQRQLEERQKLQQAMFQVPQHPQCHELHMTSHTRGHQHDMGYQGSCPDIKLHMLIAQSCSINYKG